MFHKILWLSLAGAGGTLARFGLSGLVQKFSGNSSFPCATATVNFTGCFMAGLFLVFFENRQVIPAEARIFIFAGFMGAFTTFSAFVMETGELARSTNWTYAAVNILLQNVLGFAALLAGITAGRRLI